MLALRGARRIVLRHGRVGLAHFGQQRRAAHTNLTIVGKLLDRRVGFFLRLGILFPAHVGGDNACACVGSFCGIQSRELAISIHSGLRLIRELLHHRELLHQFAAALQLRRIVGTAFGLLKNALHRLDGLGRFDRGLQNIQLVQPDLDAVERLAARWADESWPENSAFPEMHYFDGTERTLNENPAAKTRL